MVNILRRSHLNRPRFRRQFIVFYKAKHLNRDIKTKHDIIRNHHKIFIQVMKIKY